MSRTVMIEFSENLGSRDEVWVYYRSGPILQIQARGQEVELQGAEVDNLRRMLMGAANREDAARDPDST